MRRSLIVLVFAFTSISVPGLAHAATPEGTTELSTNVHWFRNLLLRQVFNERGVEGLEIRRKQRHDDGVVLADGAVQVLLGPPTGRKAEAEAHYLNLNDGKGERHREEVKRSAFFRVGVPF